MGIFYSSLRVGKNGKPFKMFKFRTLKEGTDKTSSFAQEDQYTRFGKFLRTFKIDELPQIWNIIKGDMAIVGPRPEEEKSIGVIPEDLHSVILSVRPGLTDLASLHFFEEEKMLQQSVDSSYDYWTKIKPIKIVLQIFYVQNKSWFLDAWIIWRTFTKIVGKIFK